MLPCKYQWNVKRKKARRDILNISVYTNLKHTWYMCKYRVKPYLIVLKLDCVSINKIQVMKLVAVRVSYNLNLMQSLSTQWNQQLSRYVFSKKSNVWNKTFENKLIAKDHRIPSKWSEYKIFKLKWGNIKLPNVLKYNQIKLVLDVFASSQSTLNHIKQALFES